MIDDRSSAWVRRGYSLMMGAMIFLLIQAALFVLIDWLLDHF